MLACFAPLVPLRCFCRRKFSLKNETLLEVTYYATTDCSKSTTEDFYTTCYKDEGSYELNEQALRPDYMDTEFSVYEGGLAPTSLLRTRP